MRPVHEFVQAAERSDPLRAGAQHQVIGVAEHDVGAELAHLLGIHRLDRRGGADRHEGRRADFAAWRENLAETGAAVAGEEPVLESFGQGSFVQNNLILFFSPTARSRSANSSHQLGVAFAPNLISQVFTYEIRCGFSAARAARSASASRENTMITKALLSRL